MFNGGNQTEGIAHLFRVLELSPSNIHAMADLGATMLVLGNTVEAKEYGEKALRLDPDYGPAKAVVDMAKRLENNRG